MKDDRVYLKHILRCITRIQEYTAGGRESFFASSLIQDGVIRNLQDLGRVEPTAERRHQGRTVGGRLEGAGWVPERAGARLPGC